MIDKLTPEQKSVLLAKAMGLEIKTLDFKDDTFFVVPKDWGMEWEWYEDFYDSANMALAWRVLNWAHEQNPTWDWMALTLKALRSGPADAQRLWLDKTLELAIDAGIVELESE
jgi:hypothetical protein